MTIDSIREFCLSMKEATEGMPFGEDALVFKVKNKMFVLLSLESHWFNVKCDPENALAIREEYPSVTPGYHMSKKHWNTVLLDGSVSEKKIKEWISDSYKLVVSGLPLKLQKELQ